MTKQEIKNKIKELEDLSPLATDKERDEWFLSILNGLVMNITENSVIYRNKNGYFMFERLRNAIVSYDYYRIYKKLINEYNVAPCCVDIYVTQQLLKHTGWSIYGIGVKIKEIKSPAYIDRINGYIIVNEKIVI